MSGRTIAACLIPPALTALTACGVAMPSQSYRAGYTTAANQYATAKARSGFTDDVNNGYNVAIECQMMRAMNAATGDDWIRGCIDAMHADGLKP